VEPAPGGWKLVRASGSTHHASLAEAADALAPEEEVRLALPTDRAILERLRLPDAPPEDLLAMARLQLEKGVPFPIDEVAVGIETFPSADGETPVLAIAAHAPALEEACAPFRAADRLPERVTLFAQHVAAAAPRDSVELRIFAEGDRTTFALCDRGRLALASSCDAADAPAELAPFLVGAELAGAPAHPDRALVERGLEPVAEALAEALPGLPVSAVDSIPSAESPSDADLAPPQWAEERRRILRRRGLRTKIVAAGCVWLALALAAIGYLVFLDLRLKAVERKIDAAGPDLKYVESRRGRWLALEPAVNPARSAVELLRSLHATMPSPDIKFTRFKINATGFELEGEAPSIGSAIDFAEKLKANPDLADFAISAATPTNLPDDRAQFRLFGKP
jgi:hypothetical protein